MPSPKVYLPVNPTERQLKPYAEVSLLDFEVMRLVDGHALTLREAANELGVSHSTAGRMLERARRSIALGIERNRPLCIDAEETADFQIKFDEIEPDSGQPPPERIIAIASEDGDLDSSVSSIFGRARYFIIHNSVTTHTTVLENAGAHVRRQAAQAAIHCLRQANVTDIVAGRFGPDAIELLAEVCIVPHTAKGVSNHEVIQYIKVKSA